MRIILNGEPSDLRAEATIDEAIDAAGAAASRRGVAVAVDGEVVPRGDWGQTMLADGQRVEVLQAVQGGSA
jgi:sulfur carrier protein